MKKQTFVSIRKLRQIANGTALTYGLVAPSLAEITNLYTEDVPMPIIKGCEAGRLWVDKYYVAYCLEDEIVKYTYISAFHILEEVHSYKQAAVDRGRNLMPRELYLMFKKFQLLMSARGMRYWIDERWDKEGEKHAS